MTALSNFVKEALQDFGLTEKESDVYIYLSKSCIQNVNTISKRLNMHKAQVYRILAHLRNKGFVKSTFEVPMRFEAVSFEKILELMVRVKKEELFILQGRREDLLSSWRTINIQCPVCRLGKFMIIEGRNNVFSMIFQMIRKAEKEVLIIFDDLKLLQAVKIGLPNLLEKTGVRVRFLITITKTNLKNVKTLLQKFMILRTKLIVHHVDLISGICPCFLIKDDEEAILFVLPEDKLENDKKHENGIWTNTPLVFYTKSFFEELWYKSVDANNRMLELESEKLDNLV